MKRIEIIPDRTTVLVARYTVSENDPIPPEDIIFLGKAENGYVDIPTDAIDAWNGPFITRVRKADFEGYYIPFELIWHKLPKKVVLASDGENPIIRIDEIYDICGIDAMFKELIDSL